MNWNHFPIETSTVPSSLWGNSPKKIRGFLVHFHAAIVAASSKKQVAKTITRSIFDFRALKSWFTSKDSFWPIPCTTFFGVFARVPFQALPPLAQVFTPHQLSEADVRRRHGIARLRPTVQVPFGPLLLGGFNYHSPLASMGRLYIYLHLT